MPGILSSHLTGERTTLVSLCRGLASAGSVCQDPVSVASPNDARFISHRPSFRVVAAAPNGTQRFPAVSPPPLTE
jgi:hypothetical protein